MEGKQERCGGEPGGARAAGPDGALRRGNLLTGSCSQAVKEPRARARVAHGVLWGAASSAALT